MALGQVKFGLLSTTLAGCAIDGKGRFGAFGWAHSVSAITVTDPYIGCKGVHDLSDNIYTTVETGDMQDPLGCTEDPFPPGVAAHPARGFITMDHRTTLHFFLDRSGFFEWHTPRHAA